MNPERWAKIEDIFQDALDLEGKERKEFVREKCGDDVELRAEVEKLIARFEKEESFLESPVWTDSILMQPSLKQQIAGSLEEELPAPRQAENAVGRQIGVFRLTEEIGKGGMGVVYAAERADGEFRQKVAIKLIKRGMDTDFIVKRFRHERQIAATLNHPNIARLLDGGTTSDDLPYFVLEFIDGKPLFKYAESKHLDLRQKLKLFLQICAAVFYAHSKQIIHRDIKPGNILVTNDGEPKLLDFGIAKILDPDLIHESVMPTQTQMRLMTPEYASPEQVRGDEITPASDQYSLGVLLYELITGQRPYKFPSRAPHEIARVICEEIPSEPSSGEFGKMLSNELVFDKDFCQKLDRIVLKSLRKNPAERYVSVREFAEDIERFLRNEPITAELFAATNKVLNGKKAVEPSPQIANQKSIAVLPFNFMTTLSGEKNTAADDEFLSVGLADALITRLSKVKQFIVRPTSSILPFGDKTDDSFAVGEKLNVQFVIDGSIIKTEKQIRVSVQLLNVADKSIVWAERFDEDLTDVLELEDSISNRVVESLLPKLSADEAQKLAKRSTNNNEAYEAFLRGRFHWNNFTEEGFRRAIKYFREAIELDANYAQPHAAIADYYNWLGMTSLLPSEEFYPAAVEAASRAIELDPNSSEAYAALGLAQLYGKYDWKTSEKNMLRAIELSPNNSVAHLWYTHNLYTRGDFVAGAKRIRRALELDPTSFQNHNTQAWSFYFERRLDDAVAKANELIEKFPAAGYSYFGKSAFLRLQGKAEESLKNSFRSIELSDDALFKYYGHGAALAAAGRREEAVELIENPPPHYSSAQHTAIIYCYLKEKEKALETLEKGVENHESNLIWIAVDPALDLLRDDARYFQLLEKINHPTLETIYKNPTERKTLVKDYGEKKFDSAPATRQKSIAVLPFKILNEVAGEDTNGSKFLGIGLADAMITRLSNVKQFIVRPTSSVLRYGEADADSFAAGEELNVDFVLEGNVIKTERRIRVSVQLLKINDRSIIWAERLDEDFTDVLALEDAISVKVAESIVPQMTTGELQNLAKRGTDNAEAYEAYLRGRFHWNTFTEEGFRQAIIFYRQAIELDSKYALAYAGIADYYIWLGVYGIVPPKICYPAAIDAARRAVELDNQLAEAYSSLGFAELCGEFDWVEAEKNVVRAVELNPNYAIAHLWYSYVMQTAGRFDEGIAQARKAVELDPLTYTNHHVLAWAFYFARRYAEALQQAAETVRRFPEIGLAYFTQSWIERKIGKTVEAVATSEKALRFSGASLFVKLGQAQALAADGRNEEAETLLVEIEAEGAKQYLSYYQVALVYCYLQNREKALDALERACSDKEGWLIWLKIEPALDILRGEPRFEKILHRIGSTKATQTISTVNTFSSGNFPVTDAPPTVKIARSRRNGIKQGVFLIIISFLLVPVLIALVATFDNFSTAYLLIILLICFGGGLARIVYAFLFEPKHVPSENEKSGEQKKRFLPKSVRYLLTAITVFVLGFVLYSVISHTTIDLSDSPPEQRWRNNFASKMFAKRLTTSGKSRQAILSPDGENVAYTFEDGGQRSLWIRSTDSDNARQLIAPDAVFYTELKFSSDGNYIYYIANRAPSRTLYRISVNGGTPEKISGNVWNLFALSPDGRRIAYDNRNPDNNQNSLFIADIDENAQIKSARTLVVLEMPNYFPGGIAFSPDSEKIVYPRSVIENNKEVLNLFVYDLAEKTNEKLGNDNFDRINAVEWRKYGDEIVISASENDSLSHQLWVVTYPAGEMSRMTNDFTSYVGVSLAKESAMLATTKMELTSNIWISELTESNKSYESKVRQITTGVDRQDGFSGVSWTKDGRILYTSSAGAEHGISLMNADGANNRQIPADVLEPRFPMLTGDNRFLVYADKKNQELNIWRFDMIAGTSAQVSSRYAVTPSISPDGRSMVYATQIDQTSNRLTVHRQPIEGGEETRLTDETSVRPVVSPDGRFVACNYADDETNKVWQIAVLSMDKSSAPKFIQPYKNNFFTSPQERPLAWSPDGRFLYFLNNANNIANIFRVAVEGDAVPVQVTHFTSGEIFDFALAPDGKNVVLARGSTSSDIVIFKNTK